MVRGILLHPRGARAARPYIVNRMIHFTNGAIVADALTAGGVPGRAVACADPLHDGPCLPGLSRAEWRDSRAHFLSSSHSVPLDEVRATSSCATPPSTRRPRPSEVVLWFEHDLFDQLNLIWLLDALAEAGTPEQRVRLVVIGEHPEVDPFHGLGQLSPAQLLALFPGRDTLTSEALAEARAAWADVCAPDPRPGPARHVGKPALAVAARRTAPPGGGTAVGVGRSVAHRTTGTRGDWSRSGDAGRGVCLVRRARRARVSGGLELLRDHAAVAHGRHPAHYQNDRLR